MKKLRKADVAFTLPGTVEFYDFRLDRLIRVENGEAGVVVRIADADLLEPEKMALVRHLAAEGFIPDHFQWCSAPSTVGESEIRWIVDNSWVARHHKLARIKAHSPLLDHSLERS